MRKTVLIKKVLAEINFIRSTMGFKPVDYIRKGRIGKAESCPIAKTLTCCSGGYQPVVSVGLGSIWLYNKEFEQSRNIIEFIKKFDDGKLPEYKA